MADETPSLGDIKKQINELRQERKLHTVRLNAGLKYVSAKLAEECDRRKHEHDKIASGTSSSKTDLETEKETRQSK
jgi:ABC-type molybdenum transport system ATPase subunit/photorepair protein PhrA